MQFIYLFIGCPRLLPVDFFSCIEQRLLFVVVCQLSLPLLLLSHSMGSRYTVSVVVGHWLSCSTAHRVCLDQRANLCPLHWQADSCRQSPG